MSGVATKKRDQNVFTIDVRMEVTALSENDAKNAVIEQLSAFDFIDNALVEAIPASAVLYLDGQHLGVAAVVGLLRDGLKVYDAQVTQLQAMRDAMASQLSELEARP